ncbi:MAG: hypothetical protein AAF413_03475 [Patescibacteria group bacterium]
MENLIALIVAAVLIAYPLYRKSNMLLILGMLCFGWVLQQTTSQEVLLITRSSGVGLSRSMLDTISLLSVALIPAVTTVYLTRNRIKKSTLRAIGLGLSPAIFVITWRLVTLSVDTELRQSIYDSAVQEQVSLYEGYALWSACILVILHLFLSKSKPAKAEDSKKK